MQRLFVCYHAHCYDGFGAAFAVWKGNETLDPALVKFAPCSHTDKKFPFSDEEIAGQKLVVVDFSFSREELIRLGAICELTVLDHHKSAQDQLEGLPGVIFDLSQSGAVLAWKHYNQDPVPVLLSYVQDRDLWNWKLSDSKKVSSVIDLLPLDHDQVGDPHKDYPLASFKAWDEKRKEMDKSLVKIVGDGELVLKARKKLIKEAIENSFFWIKLGGHSVPACNSALFSSEISNELYEKYPDAPFAVVYCEIAPGKIRLSLRADKAKGFDVSKVAGLFGGGGHPSASGCVLTKEQFEEQQK